MAGSGIGSAAEIIVNSGESIQAAINNATEGDTIIVDPGTYHEDITVENKNLILKSKSGNVNTTINGEMRVYEAGIPARLEVDGFTFSGNYTGVGIFTFGFSGCTAKNCRIMYYGTGMASHTDANVAAINTQFIECGTGMVGVILTSVSAENCQFINCGSALEPGGGPDSAYYSKNNVEIHTDPSGNQVITPIPDEERGYGYPEETDQPVETPTNNTTSEQPTVPSNDTTTNTTTPVEETTDNSSSSNTDINNDSLSAISGGSSSGSSGVSSHSSSGGSSGGGAGGSPEPAKNVQAKDTTKVFIQNGKQVFFNFTNDVTVVESISFTSKKTMGKTTAIVEDLKKKSSLVTDLPEGEIYRSFNVWVGNAGYGNSDNILNAAVEFKVEKSWMQENNIGQSSIVLYKYNSGTKAPEHDSANESEEWTELSTTLTGEDDDYLHFTAETPGYYSFIITGEKEISTEPTATFKGSVVNESENADVAKASAENQESPGFGIISGVVCLFCMFLYRIKNQ